MVLEEKKLKSNYIGLETKIDRKIRFILTNKCNQECGYCHREGIQKNQKELLNAATISDLVKTGKEFGVKKVTFTGGEPLKRNEILLDAVKKLKSLDFLKGISIVTNGSFLYKYASDLYKAGLNQVRINLPSLDKQKHSFITGKDYFDKIMEGISLSRDLGFEIYLNIVVHRKINDGSENLEKFIHFARDMGVNLKFIEILLTFKNKTYFKNFFLPIEKLEEKISKMGKKIANRRWWTHEYLVDGINLSAMKCSCTGDFCDICTDLIDIFVTPRGELKPCIMRNDNLVQNTDMKKMFIRMFHKAGNPPSNLTKLHEIYKKEKKKFF
jgi:cyclic pyranopterin phosphate synthase